MRLHRWIDESLAPSQGGIPQAQLHRAAYLCLDLLGTYIAGTQTPLYRLLSKTTPIQFGGRSSSLSGLAGLSPSGVALIDGMTLDSVDAHDGFRMAKGHVGCGLLPGLIAINQSLPATTGIAFLQQLVAGYELGSRLGEALHASVPDYHTSGAWIAPTVAALGSALVGLPDAERDHAMGIAEYHGPRSQMMRGIEFPTMLKDGSGFGSMVGVSSVYFAQAGMTGAPAITLEHADLESLGSTWLIDQQYVKPYACCRWIHAGIAAVSELAAQHSIALEDIRQVRVHSFDAACSLLQDWPQNTEQAQYSNRFVIAQALLHSQVLFEQVSQQAIEQAEHSAEFQALFAKIQILPDDQYTQSFPATRLAHAEIELNDGAVITGPATLASGDPERALSDAQLISKFISQASPVVGLESAQQLADLTLDLGDVADLDQWIQAVQQALGGGAWTP